MGNLHFLVRDKGEKESGKIKVKKNSKEDIKKHKISIFTGKTVISIKNKYFLGRHFLEKIIYL